MSIATSDVLQAELSSVQELFQLEPENKCMFCVVEGRKEMFYLTTHSTHFIYGYMASF